MVWSEEYKLKMSNVLKGRIKSEEWLEKIKEGIIKSEKQFSNKRNLNKWPHESGSRCPCNECADKKKQYMRDNYHKKKAA